MQIDEFAHSFLKMEMEEGLFLSRTPSGDPFWDVVRANIFWSLSDMIFQPEKGNCPSARQFLLSRLTKIRSAPVKIVSMAQQRARLRRIRPTDFTAFVCSRYKDQNKIPVDFSTADAFRALLEMGSILKIESQPNLLQDINIGSLFSVAARAYREPAGLSGYFCKVVRIVSDAERKHFGLNDPRLLEVIRGAYRYHLILRHIWGEILDRAQPRLVLMLQNGVQKGLIVEARKRQIPVVECQHGVINLMHPVYSYPPSLPPGEAVLLPDVFLLFSGYWKSQCHMPGTRMSVVGNNRFSSAGARSTRTGAAVFVCAETFRKYLSPLAVEVAHLMPERSFIMKLHPTDLSDRASLDKEYRGIPNLSVVGNEKSCPELFADASDAVTVVSTAAYEALDRGVPVHFLQKGGYIENQGLLSRRDVHLFSSAEELKSVLFKPIEGSESTPRYFDDFDPNVFREIVQSLRSGL